jgi:hypothetical protein
MINAGWPPTSLRSTGAITIIIVGRADPPGSIVRHRICQQQSVKKKMAPPATSSRSAAQAGRCRSGCLRARWNRRASRARVSTADMSNPLNWPHPPHSQAHRNLTARRLIRDAFAVRERRGDPRVVPAFTAHSFLACRPLRPRGVRHRYPEIRCRHWPSPNDHRLGTPDTPAIRSTRAVDFVASLVRFRYSLPGCSPCTDQTGTPSLRGLLLPGFQRIGLPPRCWI